MERGKTSMLRLLEDSALDSLPTFYFACSVDECCVLYITL